MRLQFVEQEAWALGQGLLRGQCGGDAPYGRYYTLLFFRLTHSLLDLFINNLVLLVSRKTLSQTGHPQNTTVASR